MKLTTKEVEEAYEKNYASLRKFVYSILKDSDRSHEVVQETFVRLMTKYTATSEDPAPWLFAVSRNISFKIIKKDKRLLFGECFAYSFVDEADMPPGALAQAYECYNSPLDLLVEKDEAGRVEFLMGEAMSMLPVKLKAVMYLRYFCNMSYIEIAKKLRTTHGNVGVMINVAKKKLRKNYNTVTLSIKCQTE